MVVANRSGDYFCPWSPSCRGEGRSWARSDASNLSGVERKNKQNTCCLKIQLPNSVGKQMGNNTYGTCNVTGWTDIVQFVPDWFNTVGLKSDGTLIVAGAAGNTSGMYDVGDWIDIKQVAAGAGAGYNLGLCYNRTVVVAETEGTWPDYGQCDVGNWTDIIQIDARGPGTMGLKSNNTVLAMGYNVDGQLNVTGWTDIIQVAKGLGHTVGLKSDGTLVAVGMDYHGQCSGVASWDLIP